MEKYLVFCFLLGLFLVFVSFMNIPLMGVHQSKFQPTSMAVGVYFMIGSLLYYLKLDPPVMVIAVIVVVILILLVVPYIPFPKRRDDRAPE